MSLDATGLRIYLSCKPCDMRKSIDGLTMLVQTQLQMDPFENCLTYSVIGPATNVKSFIGRITAGGFTTAS
jgi:transposase